MARSMLSSGMFSALAASMAVRSRALPSGSPPPWRAAMVISRISLVKTAPRFRSEEDRGASGPVGLIGHLFVLDPFELSGALLDGALDVVERHVLSLGGLDGGAEPGIAVGVTAPLACGDGDFTDQPGEDGAALLVRDGLFSIDLLPFTVTGHGHPV